MIGIRFAVHCRAEKSNAKKTLCLLRFLHLSYLIFGFFMDNMILLTWI